MNSTFSWKFLLESIIYSIVTVILFGFLAIIPLFDLVLLVWPIPYIYLTVRRGWTYGAAAFLLSALWITFLLSPVFGILFIVLFGPVAFAASFFIIRKTSALEGIIISAGVILLSLAVIIGSVYLWLQKDLFVVISDEIKALLNNPAMNFQQAMKLYQDMGLIDKGLTVTQIAGQIEDALRRIFPTVMLITSITGGFFVYYFSIYMLKRKGLTDLSLPPFCRWRLPGGMGLGLVGMLIAAIVGSYLGLRNFGVVLFTIINLVSFIFTIQGLSLGEYLLKYKKVPWGLRVLILLISFIFLQYVLTTMGILEQVFHIRKVMESRARHL